MKNNEVDAVVIGGGFYGCAIAVYLAQTRKVGRVVLLEREEKLLSRASYNNQARVHNGYHYPRSFTTAYRSRVNLPKFVHDWPNAVRRDFVKLYAIARHSSKVTPRQFERFCHEIGARVERAEGPLTNLFEPRLIEAVYRVEEYAFDSTRLAEWARQELDTSGVHVRTRTKATSITRTADKKLCLSLQAEYDEQEHITSRFVFNCTYSGINQFLGDFPGTAAGIKHEVTEMALLQLPPSLRALGITVMDGPFFSLMPFPGRGLHTLSHVRYTPHFNWRDELGIDPYMRLTAYDRVTRVDRMIRDVSRFLPAISNSEYVESLFEVKTVLLKNESDDGRPILFEKSGNLPGCYSILGGKIDNIYDVLEKLDSETLI